MSWRRELEKTKTRAEWIAHTETEIFSIRAKYPNPPCNNHPDRPANAFYKDGHNLCLSCLTKRLGTPMESSE